MKSGLRAVHRAEREDLVLNPEVGVRVPKPIYVIEIKRDVTLTAEMSKPAQAHEIVMIWRDIFFFR